MTEIDSKRRRELVIEQTAMCLEVTAYRTRLIEVADGLLVSGKTVRKEAVSRSSGKMPVASNRVCEDVEVISEDVSL